MGDKEPKEETLIDVITVDLDFDFEWYKSHSNFVDERVKTIPEVESVKIRHSATGRTHLMIKLSWGVPLFESFLIRAYIGDDPYRLACDLSRYYTFRTPDSYMRLFDEKVNTKGRKTAGDWLDWAIDGTRKGIEKLDKGLR